MINGKCVIGMSCPHVMNGEYRRWMENYSIAVHRVGGVLLGLPFVYDLALLSEQLDAVDGVLLSGGCDIDPKYFGEENNGSNPPSPERDEFEALLIKEVMRRDLPLLGICRGIQSMNVFMGGTIHQDLPNHPHGDGVRHLVRLSGKLAEIMGEEEISTNSFHHQGLKVPAPGWVFAGTTEDGVAEVLECPSARFAMGVQWHPERSFAQENDPFSRKLFEAFLAACRP